MNKDLLNTFKNNNVKEILSEMDWKEIFGNTSQKENFYELIFKGYNFQKFVEGFYPKSNNKRLVKLLKESFIEEFIYHSRQIYNIYKPDYYHETVDRIFYVKKYIENI